MTKKEAVDLPSEPFNQGSAMIGTGPYRFVERVPNTRTVVSRFDGYWGGKPAFDTVLLRPIPDEGARVAAMPRAISCSISAVIAAAERWMPAVSWRCTRSVPRMSYQAGIT